MTNEKCIKSTDGAARMKNPSNSRLSGSKRLYNFLLFVVALGVTLVVCATLLEPASNFGFDGSASRPRMSGKEHILEDFKRHGIRKGEARQVRQQKNVTGSDDKYEESSSSSSSSPPPPQYHLVFSTSCDDQQNWESYVFFYHAFKVKQPGTVTRITSGCTTDQAKELLTFHNQYIRPFNPENFFLHLTPNFATLTKEQGLGDKRSYKYMNKPFGLRHWMEGFLKMNETDHSSEAEEGIVILMDPDMILLRPIMHDFRQENVIFVKDDPDTMVVKHGFPIAQQDGYLQNRWMYLNVSYVTNGGNIDNLNPDDGPRYYNTGPPYLATVRDMYNIALLWCDYAPRVYHIHAELFAEMYGYIFATTQLNLPHTLIKSIVVSTPPTQDREGWPFIDAIPDTDICAPPENAVMPIGLHYCQRYYLDHWFFSKYRLKKKYISCGSPLLELPPLDLATRNITIAYQPPPDGHPQPEAWVAPTQSYPAWQSKREAFMICALIQRVNEAAIHFKEHHCDGHANMATFSIYSDPHDY